MEFNEEENKFLYRINSNINPTFNLTSNTNVYERHVKNSQIWENHSVDNNSNLFFTNHNHFDKNTLNKASHDSKLPVLLQNFDSKFISKDHSNENYFDNFLKLATQSKNKELSRPPCFEENVYKKESSISQIKHREILTSYKDSGFENKTNHYAKFRSPNPIHYLHSKKQYYYSSSPKRSRHSGESFLNKTQSESLYLDKKLNLSNLNCRDNHSSLFHTYKAHEEYLSPENLSKNYDFLNTSKKSLPSIPKIKKLEKKLDSSKYNLEQLSTEKEKLSNQISSLKALLEKTIKKKCDIIRNSRRIQSQISKDPQYTENLRLQHDVEKRIKEVKKKLEEIDKQLIKNKISVTSINSQNIDLKKNFKIDKEKETNALFKYIDPGNHFCSKCDKIFSKAKDFFEHLHKKEHWKHVDPNEQVWNKTFEENKPETSQQVSDFFKGIQLLLPVKGFYCSLCDIFLGNNDHAEKHVNAVCHNQNYNKMILEKPYYEQNQNIEYAKINARIKKLKQKNIKETSKENYKKQKSQTESEIKCSRKDKLFEKIRKKPKQENMKNNEKENKKIVEIVKNKLNDQDNQDKKNKETKTKQLMHDVKLFQDVNNIQYGPFFPFNDPKLAKKIVVEISSLEKKKCYKKLYLSKMSFKK